jgi:arabinofuranosyltransferase
MNPSVSADLGPSAPDADSAFPAPARPRRRAWSSALRQLPVAIPPLAWAALGWHRRWLADDGLIAARTVRQILAGNGPVFNAGERVEADTSTLWTWLLALITWVSRLDVYTVMIWTGVLLAPLGLLFALLGARELHRRHAPDRLLLPVGAAVVLALPPFWDFVTSGLEDSLVFCWLGLCWWLLAGLRPDSRCRAGWLAFVAGLGWLVRPDMAIGTVLFLAALWYIVRPSWRRCALLVVIAGVLPAAYQVFRMGYYGLLVPNTAVAKDASSTHFSKGVTYLANFVSPYRLWIPLLLLLALLPLTVGRRLDRGDVVRCAAAVGSGVLMAAYVVAIGGDFMHARMLLPATFALLLPAMMLPVPKPGAQAVRTAVPAALCVVAIGAWAVACGAGWRAVQLPGIIPRSGIADERAYWSVTIRQQNPDNAAKYVAALMGSATATGSPEWLITQDANSGKPVLLYRVTKYRFVAVPLNRPRYPVAIVVYILGAWGAGTPLDGLVVDQRGLSYALGSHVTGTPDGRPGHTRFISPAWIAAEYSNVTKAPGIPATQLTAARKALSCGALAELDQATQAPLTIDRFVSSFFHSPSLTTFRFSPNPVVAEEELCG